MDLGDFIKNHILHNAQQTRMTYLPTLSEEKQKEIGGDVTLEEVQQTIKRLRTP